MAKRKAVNLFTAFLESNFRIVTELQLEAVSM
jgi:hypothetical protein